MKIRILSIIAVIAGISLIWGTSAPTHSGRTDSSGGHHNRKTGGYHYHNGGATRTSRTVKAPSRSRSVTTLPAEPRWHNPSSPDFYKKWSDNLVDREIALTERELALDKRENLLRERERAVTERERAVSATHIALTEQAAAFTIKEQNLFERELNLAKKVINVHVTQCMRDRASKSNSPHTQPAPTRGRCCLQGHALQASAAGVVRVMHKKSSEPRPRISVLPEGVS